MSRDSDRSAEVLVIIADLQVSAKVLCSDLTARQDVTLETRIIVYDQELATPQRHGGNRHQSSELQLPLPE